MAEAEEELGASLEEVREEKDFKITDRTRNDKWKAKSILQNN